MKLCIVILLTVFTTQTRSRSDEADARNLSSLIQYVCKDYHKETNIYDTDYDISTDKQKLPELKNINELLKFMEEKVDQHFINVSEKILVLGNSGVGVSTFVQFLAGDLSRLFSVEVGLGTGQFIIKDGNKIGSSETESFSSYPEEFIFDETTSICDIPGFSKYRSVGNEFFVNYNIARFLNKNNHVNVKIVLLTEYSSVEHGISNHNFINLLKNLYNNFAGIANLKHNIVLIAVKVSNICRATNTTVRLINNTNVINSIGDFVKQVKLSLIRLKEETYDKEPHFFDFSIDLLEVLQKTDEEGNFVKINIFHRPSQPGILLDMTTLIEEKQSIISTIKKTESKALYSYYTNFYKALPPALKNTTDCLIQGIQINLQDIFKQVFDVLPCSRMYKLRSPSIICMNKEYCRGNDNCYLPAITSRINELIDEINLMGKLEERISSIQKYQKYFID